MAAKKREIPPHVTALIREMAKNLKARGFSREETNKISRKLMKNTARVHALYRVYRNAPKKFPGMVNLVVEKEISRRRERLVRQKVLQKKEAAAREKIIDILTSKLPENIRLSQAEAQLIAKKRWEEVFLVRTALKLYGDKAARHIYKSLSTTARQYKKAPGRTPEEKLQHLQTAMFGRMAGEVFGLKPKKKPRKKAAKKKPAKKKPAKKQAKRKLPRRRK